MKQKICLVLFLILSMTAAGCSKQNNSSVSDHGNASASPENTDTSENGKTDSTSALDPSQIFTDRDQDAGYDQNKGAIIQLNKDSATCSSNAVQISGSTVTITDEGTYILSGALNDGMIIVNTDQTDKVQLVLDNAAIHSKTCAPIYILQSDKVFITLAANSKNTLSNSGKFTAIDENNIDAVIFSKDDLTLNGAGSLTTTSPAGHGIVSKDSLKITGGSYDISCSSHAISGKDDVCITNANFKLTAGKDGIHAENVDDASAGYVCILNGTFHISSEGDGITASSHLQIEDGSFDIKAGGGSVNASSHSSDSWGNFRGGGRHQNDKMNQNPPDTEENSDDKTSMKGLKAGTNLLINGGKFTIDSADDSFHSNQSVTVTGGTFEIASGDDAFHADKTLAVTAGTINITESYEGLEGEQVNISGGNITLTASDDGLNAAGGTDASGNTGGRDGKFGGHGASSSSNGSIKISGGTLKITASSDGIDSNGTLEITGGNTTVSGPTQGDTATLDYDASGTISGGTFIGTGASGRMTQTFSESEQGVISANVGSQPGGTQIKLSDSKGNTLITHTPKLDFELVILSSPDIISGETYTLKAGNSSSEFTAE